MPERQPYDWHDAVEYLEGLLPTEIRELEKKGQARAGVTAQPTVGPSAAQLVSVLILAQRARSVLEIGTSTGFSAMAMGGALRRVGGKLLTIEIEPRLAQVAEKNVHEAGLDDVVEILVDDANQVIPRLTGPYELILQDGDKDDYLRMLPRLVDLLAPHGLLVTDDVLFPVMDLPEPVRPFRYALSLYNQALHDRAELQTVWLPVGDGIAISVKLPGPIT